MAIEWGPWEGSGNRMRVGIDVNWEPVAHSEGAATVTVKYYTENNFSWSDDQKLNLSGAIDGSVSFHNGGGDGSVALRETRSKTYNYGPNEYGSSPGTWTFSATLAGAYNGITPSKSVSSKIPARPIDAPLAPTNVDVSRISDGSQKVTWTNRDSAGNPWGTIRVQRDVGDDNTWATVGTPGGGASSFTDSNTVSNQKYRYRVRAENSVGDSAYVETYRVYTTPAAPASAVRTQSGADQVVTWSNRAGYAEYDTQVWRAVNGVWSLLATKGSGVTSHTDVAPSAADQIKYRVRHVTNQGQQPTLYSAYSGETTETPGLTTPPAAPTNLSPSGITVDPTMAQTWSWTYTSTDTTPQSAYELRHRLAGTTDWTTVSANSSTPSRSMPANLYPELVTVEWQVRVKGADPAFSEWSEPVSFTTSVAAIPPDPVKIPVVHDMHTGRLEASTTAYELRNYVMRFQSFSLIGGGVRAVDSSYGISWTSRFLPIALGRSQSTFPRGHHDIDNPYGWTVTNKELTNNKAKLTVSTSQSGMRLRVGETMVVSGVGAPFDGTWTVRETTTNTVTYDIVAPNVASAAGAGNVYPRITGHGGAASATPVGGKITLGNWNSLWYELPFGWGGGSVLRKNGLVKVTQKALTNNVIVLNVQAPHYFAIGDRIDIEIGDPVFDGQRTLTAMTTNTLSFSKTNANITAAPVTDGLVRPSGKDTFFGNFHLVDYTTDFVVPDNWILLALRNVDGANVEWGTGDWVDPGYDSDSPVFKQAVFTSTTDVNVNAGNKPPLRIGNLTGTHMRIDGNEIQSMSGDAAVGDLILQQGGGEVRLGTGGGGVTIGPSGKKFKRVWTGFLNATTGSNGRMTVTHGVGETANYVFAFPNRGGFQPFLESNNINNVVFEIRDYAGAVQSGVTGGLHVLCFWI